MSPRALLEVSELKIIPTRLLRDDFKPEPNAEQISFELRSGELLGIIGRCHWTPSRLLEGIAGLLLEDQTVKCTGSVYYRGQNFFKGHALWRAQAIAHISPFLQPPFDLRVEEAISLSQWNHRGPGDEHQNRVHRSMERAFCSHLQGRMLHTLTSTELQWVAIARGLMQGSKILIFNAILAHMDLASQKQAQQLLREITHEGHAVLFTLEKENDFCATLNRCLFI